MDQDKNLVGYNVEYRYEDLVFTRTETREYHVGFVIYISNLDKWRAKFRDDPHEAPSTVFDSVDEARSYLIQRYEQTVFGKKVE
jgi:hypothetical protein